MNLIIGFLLVLISPLCLAQSIIVEQAFKRYNVLEEASIYLDSDGLFDIHKINRASFSKRAVDHSIQQNNSIKAKSFEIHDTILTRKLDAPIKSDLRHMMWQHVGIVRSISGLLEVDRFISFNLAKPIGRLLRLRLLTAQAIVKAALDRKKSLGVHYILEELE